MADLQGFVDSFDGKRLSGWALDPSDPSRTLEVEIFVDDLRVATVRADVCRPDLITLSRSNVNKGFAHTFSPPLYSRVGGAVVLPDAPRLTVKHAGTDLALGVVPELMGVVNVDYLRRLEDLCVLSDNRFLPDPDGQMIEHVAHQGATAADFRAVGMYLLLDLLHLGLLRDRAVTVVDLGCGCGRIALHLAPYLADCGRYFGFDTWGRGIQWASEKITPLYPGFHFQQLGDAASTGKDPGYVGTAAYPLPLPADSCDLVVAASLMTHLTYDATLAYLEELHRVLKPDGRAYVTFFILDQQAETLLAKKSLKRDQHGAYFHHRNYFDSYFSEGSLASLLAGSGLRETVRRYGYWRGEEYKRRKPFGYQDLLVLQRDGRAP